MDVVTPDKRSEMMSGIRSKNTKPELQVRRLLFSLGYRFRLHRKDLPGTPDIVMPSRRVAIFVHGCFWHRHKNCSLAKLPKTNSEFWKKKLSGNVRRDKEKYRELARCGWRTLVIWECAVRREQQVGTLGAQIKQWVESGIPYAELPPA